MENDEQVTAYIIIQRFDKNDDCASTISEPTELNFNTDLTYEELLENLYKILNLNDKDNRILKLRQPDGILVTLTTILQGSTKEEPFTLDVTDLHQNLPAQKKTISHPIYVDAVRSKLRSMDKRITRVESLMPQLRWRRQMNAERAMHSLSSKVCFLERRFDELTPPQWKPTMS